MHAVYRRLERTVPILLLLCIVAAGPAQAADLSVAIEWQHLENREVDRDGRTLNREEGSIPGVSLQGLWALSSRLKSGISFSHHRGEVDYSGETQAGRPLVTRTRTRVETLGAWLEYELFQGPVELALVPAVRFRQWHRDIKSTATTVSLETRYRWWMPELALQAEWRPAAGHRVIARAGGFRTTGIDARVDLRTIGAGKVVIEPDDGYGQRLFLSWSTPVSDGPNLAVYAYFEKAVFRASDPVSVSAGNRRFIVREPESTHWERGLGVGLTF